MLPATKPMFSLTAADLMSASVVLVPADMSLKSAANLLAEAAVTGAPVVNADGRCIGVLSATDFVHWMIRNHYGPNACAASPAFYCPWQMVDPGVLPDEAVQDYMTRDPVMVTASATLGELARKMIDVHIHRVIVTDRYGKPIGVVSSTDILAAVVRADQAHNGVTAGKVNETVAC